MTAPPALGSLFNMPDAPVTPAMIVRLRHERNTCLVSLPKLIRDAAELPPNGYVCLRVLRPGVIYLTTVELKRAPNKPRTDRP